MDMIQLGNKILNSRLARPLLALGNRLLYVDAIRRPLVRALDRWLTRDRGLSRDRAGAPLLLPPNPRFGGWHKIEQQRTLIYLAALHTVDRVIEKRILSPRVAETIAALWGRVLCTPPGRSAAVQQFRHEHGFAPPWFLVLSPGRACNLSCPGCYASSGADLAGARAGGHGAPPLLEGRPPASPRLPWSTLDRIMTEAKQRWGVPLFVFSGGEPLAYRSEGGERARSGEHVCSHDVLDAVEKHADCLFLMFTNGTLIDRETAARLARLRNLTPALSVEGFRQRTDERRGAGTFDRVLEAMAHLRQAGVPFGISVTVTRANCGHDRGQILSDEFLDFFFDQQGAFYGFFFQYMPIGTSPNLDWVPAPEQRVAFWRRSWEVVTTRHILLLDFWNHGPLVEGCISAGRDRGYLYVDWNGKVMPCVFVPYAAANMEEIYARGGNLDDVWGAPFFQAIRQWQRDYGYHPPAKGGRQELSAEGNWMRPCPLCDHPHVLREWIARYQPEPEDEAAAAALLDDTYWERMAAHARELSRVSQQIWEEEYLGQT